MQHMSSYDAFREVAQLRKKVDVLQKELKRKSEIIEFLKKYLIEDFKNEQREQDLS